jgi:hypothetical protein
LAWDPLNIIDFEHEHSQWALPNGSHDSRIEFKSMHETARGRGTAKTFTALAHFLNSPFSNIYSRPVRAGKIQPIALCHSIEVGTIVAITINDTRQKSNN